MASLSRSAPVQWPTNGHYYELVLTNITWQDALATASSNSFAGLPGHLATVTSSAENDFILTNFATGTGSSFAWLGGSAPANNAVWLWSAGPELGVQFALGASPTPPYNYANWGGVEPNHSQENENYLMMNIGLLFSGIETGQWADASPNPSPGDPVVGYIVEYEPAGPPPSVHYVNADNPSPAFPFDTWETAATNIQDAVDAASPLARVVVTNGVYQTGGLALGGGSSNRVAVTQPITIESVNGPSVTIIAGSQVPGTTNGPEAVRCVYLTDGAVLSGFTLTGGATHDANTSQDVSGGGVWCQSENAVITNCIVTGNAAWSDGAGAHSGTLERCRLVNNTLFRGGGGGASGANLNNCIIIGNQASSGGGASGCTLRNCTVVGNYAFVRGSGSGVGGGTAGSTAYNSIIYYNDTAGGFETNTFLAGFQFNCCTAPDAGWFGNITNEPGFVDVLNGDFHLVTNSPCINSGAARYMAAGPDFDGNPRVSGGKPDIGAFEFQDPASTVSYAWLLANGFPTDGSADFADPDGDHMSNHDEWLAGTDPHDPESALRMFTPVAEADSVLLSWQSVGTRTYTLERATNVSSAANFTPIAENLFGQPPANGFRDYPPADATAVFYRVRTDGETYPIP